MSETLRALIRDIPDFPKKGILFRDITPLLLSPAGMKETSAAQKAPDRSTPFEQQQTSVDSAKKNTAVAVGLWVAILIAAVLFFALLGGVAYFIWIIRQIRLF